MTQLINSNQTQIINEDNGKLIDVLQDIACNVEIKSHFCILHPNYQPLELPEETIARFENLSNQMQQKYLSLQLQNFLYGIYYNGSLQSQLALDNQTKNLPIDLDNNSILGIDVDFYEKLHESNFGAGYFDPGWLVLREEIDKSLAVKKGSLTLHIEREKHLQDCQQNAVVGNNVAIKMPKNLIQNGFYLAVSNTEPKSHNNMVRVYFNFTPGGAVGVMHRLTQLLNDIPIFFHFKVLYNPVEYNRHDSGVLYIEKPNYEAVRKALKIVYTENKSHFKPEIPLFTKQLAPGLGLAEEPDSKFAQQESFGMNRCQMVANGLLQTWLEGDNSPEARIKAIHEQFSHLGIDLERPYLNADSEDIYKLLNIE
ncbi:MAG: T3SS effector HopA1 family protein [Rivularia sp. ALOHA_DT_140]|nr:T3SS effector HopA1 family protein [Rivularia sp. ALOHA_DT_140]